jgi:hypothetical protein
MKENARMEFEQAKHERDAEMIQRMLVVGRDAFNQTMEKITGRDSYTATIATTELSYWYLLLYASLTDFIVNWIYFVYNTGH